jgi:hypothetical protein
MDYSYFSSEFLVRNDMAELVQSRLVSNKLLLGNTIETAIDYNSVKTFDVLINHCNENNIINQWNVLTYFNHAIKNFYKNNNRYFSDKLLDILLTKFYVQTSKFYLLVLASNIKYDLDKLLATSPKEITKIQKQLKKDYINYVIRHPNFKFEEFILSSKTNNHGLNKEILTIIREYSVELGINNNTFLNFLAKLLVFNNSNSSLLSKTDMKVLVNFYGIEMLMEDVVLITTKDKSKHVKMDLTKEKEEYLVELFKKLINTIKKYDENETILNLNIDLKIFRILYYLSKEKEHLYFDDYMFQTEGSLCPFMKSLANTQNKIILNFIINSLETDKEKYTHLTKIKVEEFVIILKGFL